MIVWTVLETEDDEYRQLKDNGYLICDHNHPKFLPNQSDFKNFTESYDWISIQLRKKTNSWKNWWYNFRYSTNKIQYPRWLWYKVDGYNDPLAVNKAFYSGIPGNYQILVFDIDPSLVLLSDFEAWHHVLNRWYFCYTEEESDQWEKYLELHNINDMNIWDINYINKLSPEQKELVPSLQKKIIDSWQGIFDINNPSEYAFGKIDDRTVQGVTWVLRKKDFRFSYDITITQEDIDKYSGDDEE